MKRNITADVIVLKNYRIGEHHKGVVMLTRNEGILQAVAYGAYKTKSKLRNTSSPFCASRCDLYYNPVKDSWKIVDMAERHYFPAIRESLERFYAASLWSEIILKSYGGGESGDRLFTLFFRGLSLLESEKSAESVDYISIQFLWRYLWLAGFQPDLKNCCQCNKKTEFSKFVYYNRIERGLICHECAGQIPKGLDRGVTVTPQGIQYLEYTETLKYPEAAAVTTEAATRRQLLAFLYRQAEDIVETPLNSLKMLRGL